MIKLIKITWALSLVLLVLSVKSQDFHLSQYEAAPLYLNPSLTGAFEGQYRFALHYRNQWTSIVRENAFHTAAFSIDRSIKKFGVGLYVINNRAGASKFNVLNAVVTGAYDWNITGHHHIRIGIQAGLIQKSFSLDDLFFEDTYYNSAGGGFAGSTSETFTNTSIILPEFNAGVMYYFSNRKARINPFVGGSVFHIVEFQESFFGVNNTLPRRYLGQAGVKLNVSEVIQLNVQYLGMHQTNNNEYTVSLFGTYYLEDPDIHVLFGATWRNEDAVMAHLGLRYQGLTYRFSYDFNTSSLSTISSGQGAFEMSIVYIFKKHNPNPVIACPRL